MGIDGSARPQAPQAPSPVGEPPTLGIKIFFAVAILMFGALGVLALKGWNDTRSQTQELNERGVETTADVMSFTEPSGRRGDSQYEIQVSYDPPGDQLLEFATVTDCTEEQFDTDAEQVQIVYHPEDPELIRMADCANSVDNYLGLIFGPIFLGLALVLVWRSRDIWTA